MGIILSNITAGDIIKYHCNTEKGRVVIYGRIRKWETLLDNQMYRCDIDHSDMPVKKLGDDTIIVDNDDIQIIAHYKQLTFVQFAQQFPEILLADMEALRRTGLF